MATPPSRLSDCSPPHTYLTRTSNSSAWGAWSIIDENIFPGDIKYSINDIPDMAGKVVLVTGSMAGIGKETSRVLLTKNATVWITARDMSKDAHLLLVDLANLKSIKAAAEEFLSKEMQLNVLFNNAGVMLPPMDQLTDDGYDLQFGTNGLGHFYFTKLVLPLLLSTAKSAPDDIARVVNTSSNGHCSRNPHVVDPAAEIEIPDYSTADSTENAKNSETPASPKNKPSQHSKDSTASRSKRKGTSEPENGKKPSSRKLEQKSGQPNFNANAKTKMHKPCNFSQGSTWSLSRSPHCPALHPRLILDEGAGDDGSVSIGTQVPGSQISGRNDFGLHVLKSYFPITFRVFIEIQQVLFSLKGDFNHGPR
ncbi:hypothetical protein BU15DRAFT_83782 [Melanogaster broomeanus]|nr:hypothetical protein BU15DRAFT_83782 [Melanogaster broomeanus]